MLVFIEMIAECPGCRSRYDVSGRPAGTKARCRCGTVFRLLSPNKTAGSLACPNCGGLVAATNHECEHCSSPLLVKACPRCFERIFHGHEHCHSCGESTVTPASVLPEGNAKLRDCPRCEKPTLVARIIDDFLIDECSQCHGMFVDVTALSKLVQERQTTRAESVLGKISRDIVPDPPNSSRVYLRCPVCEVVMNRVLFAKGSGIIVDVCRHHGTWFDWSELSSVLSFVIQGGLHQSKGIPATVTEKQSLPLPQEYLPEKDLMSFRKAVEKILGWLQR